MNQKLASEYNYLNENSYYWTNGKNVFWLGFKIQKADIETFEHYYGHWGKDKNNCYNGSIVLKNANTKSFNALNYVYAKDNINVWSYGPYHIKNADAQSFEICDTAQINLGKMIEDDKILDAIMHYGYGKDKNNVYYYENGQAPKIVKCASPKTFVSLDDGYFGIDEANVYCKKYKLQKASPKTWKKIKEGYYYSIDKKIYYLNEIVKNADLETFEVIEMEWNYILPTQLAKDKNHYYFNERIITKEEKEEFEEYIRNKK